MPRLTNQPIEGSPLPIDMLLQSVFSDEAITPKAYTAAFRDSIRRLLDTSEFYYRSMEFGRAGRKINELVKLQENWDSYGAPPPTETSRLAALSVLRALDSLGLPPTSVMPSAEGGIGLCFVKGNRYADIECLNTGEILAVKYVGSEPPGVWVVEAHEESILAAIKKIRVHLAA